MAEAEDSTAPTKACKRCGEVKALTGFSTCRRATDGREGTCTSCKNARRSDASKLVATGRVKSWKRQNPGHWRELKAAQDERARRRAGVRPRAEVVAETAERREAARRERFAMWETRNAERQSRPWSASGLTPGQRHAVRYKLDPEFNLRQRLRASLKRKRQGIKLAELVRGALAREGASPKAEAFLGFTVADLRKHLERQFTSGMTWPVFVTGAIHIDHIVPLAAHDLSSADGLRQAWQLTNLRPAWAGDNMAKAARREFLI